MLLSENVYVKWNSKTKRHYVELGYNFIKMGDSFLVKVNDLTKGSNVKVLVSCDYCGKEYQISWDSYQRLKSKEIIHKDCCGDAECTTKKSQDTLLLKYKTTNIREIPGVNEKITNTNIERYGSGNCFSNDEVKEKIRNTNIQKYGVPYCTQNTDVQNKYKRTCIERYGVDNYSKTVEFRKSMSGENSPVWKENPIHERTERMLPEYRDWRKQVFERDGYTCQACGAHNHKGNDGTVCLNAHHLYNFIDNKDKAVDVDNGVTLCKQCHIEFHKIYGKKNNTPEQFVEFKRNINENVR